MFGKMLSFLSMKDGRKISQEESLAECRELIGANGKVPKTAVPDCFLLTKYPTGHTSKGKIVSIETIRAMEKALGGKSIGWPFRRFRWRYMER